MFFDADYLPAPLRWACLLVTLLSLALAVWRAPWRDLVAVQARQHLWLGSMLALGLLWCMDIAPLPQVHFHTLGVTIAVIVFGLHLGLLALLGALLIATLIGPGQWASFGANALSSILLPGLACWWLLLALRHWSRRQVFVFFLGGGFAGGMLAVLVTAAASVALLWLGGHREEAATALESAALLPLLMFSEGFLNGFVATTLSTYQPQLVRTFEDQWLE